MTDAGRGSAIAVLRSLAKAGLRTIAADSDANCVGFRSRCAHDRFVYPDPEKRPDRFVAAIREAVQDRGVDLIIPVTDATLLPLSRARLDFEGLCQLALPEADALDATTDKWRTVCLAEELGVSTPKTVLVSTVAEALDAAEEFDWPVVLKPKRSRTYSEDGRLHSHRVCYAENSAQLAERMGQFEGNCDVLLQQHVAGRGVGVELLMHEGRPLAAFQHRRLREVPVGGGVSSLRESCPLDPVLYGHAIRLLGELRWTGLAMVEFKVRDAHAWLMEINGRVWGSLPLATRSGVDFPGQLAKLYLDGAPAVGEPVDSDYPAGVRCRNLELDLVWMASVLLRRTRQPWMKGPSRWKVAAAVLGLLNPATRMDVFSWRDPGPALASVAQVVRKRFRKLIQSRQPASKQLAWEETLV